MDAAQVAHFNNYSPASFGWAAYDPEQDPNWLVPFSYKGVSYGRMHKLYVPIYTRFLDVLVPLIDGGLVPGECGCYNPSSVTVGGDRSFHTYGIAADNNWSQNPMYAPRHPTGPYTLPLETGAIARSFGLEWGGDWTYPQDWMHVELHLSPADAAAFGGQLLTPVEEDMKIVLPPKGKVAFPVLLGGGTPVTLKSAALASAYKEAGVPFERLSLAGYNALRTAAGS